MEAVPAVPASTRPPLLLLIHMPWFSPNPEARDDPLAQRGYHGHIRVAALLDKLKYRCALSPLNIRMVVMVQQGELAGCLPLCGDACTCVEAGHHREFMQRNLAAHATGSEDLLFTHADCWLNLNRLTTIIDRGSANYTMTPARGLHGTSYRPIRSECFPVGPQLEATAEWFWHLNSKQTCAAAVQNETHGLPLRECCYNWVDLAFLPRHTHAAFRRAVPAFWDVQWEVALPTVLHGLAAAGIAEHRPLACVGGCCVKVPWTGISPSRLCAHRVDLEQAHARGIPQALAPIQCAGGGGRGGAAAALGEYRSGGHDGEYWAGARNVSASAILAGGWAGLGGMALWGRSSWGMGGGGRSMQRRHFARTHAGLRSLFLG